MIETIRYTEYHCGVAVIKDRNLLSEAMAKLARYEDMEDDTQEGDIEETPLEGSGE